MARAHAPDARTLLRIYVNDHRAGSVAGLRLARRCARRNAGSPAARVLEGIVEDIAADARALQMLAEQLQVPRNRLKAALAVLADLVTRLKLNGAFVRYSPLSRLLEIEALMAGIDAKRSLWRALRRVDSASELGIDLPALEARASDQRERLLPLHQEAAGIFTNAR